MFRRRKPLWRMLVMAALIIAAWWAFLRYQMASIDCAIGAIESC